MKAEVSYNLTIFLKQGIVHSAYLQKMYFWTVSYLSSLLKVDQAILH